MKPMIISTERFGLAALMNLGGRGRGREGGGRGRGEREREGGRRERERERGGREEG